MDIRNKLYQMFILGTEGDCYKEALKNNLGGIIFFTKDIQAKEQFKSLIKDIKSIAKTSPFLSIDQEGGRVERTENIHKGKKYLSAKYAFEKGEDFLAGQTKEIAKELKDFGINLNFAPCIDVNTNPNNPIIGERAFSDNPDDVIKGEKIVSQIYRENGIIPCAKHFPGHGDANADSHLTLPEINLPLNEMEKIHIKPFKMCAKTVEMIMVAHLHCTCFEKNVIPTSLSKNAIDYLRNNLGFDGVIISDDMVMKGVSCFGAVEACEKGIRAGLNLFIYRNSAPETIQIIETIAQKALTDKELANKIEESFERIKKVKSEL
ncbi:glycoside hydrolase family 3 protein [bacterium]|nr:glycoside hydrolase family 3 protein [bacterium]